MGGLGRLPGRATSPSAKPNTLSCQVLLWLGCSSIVVSLVRWIQSCVGLANRLNTNKSRQLSNDILIPPPTASTVYTQSTHAPLSLSSVFNAPQQLSTCLALPISQIQARSQLPCRPVLPPPCLSYPPHLPPQQRSSHQPILLSPHCSKAHEKLISSTTCSGPSSSGPDSTVAPLLSTTPSILPTILTVPRRLTTRSSQTGDRLQHRVRA